jgi:2-keto-4-pentenoate hydratase/2-oxohepta-3-ene-1,7-dioic acid hydratase in catechol pathway
MLYELDVNDLRERGMTVPSALTSQPDSGPGALRRPPWTIVSYTNGDGRARGGVLRPDGAIVAAPYGDAGLLALLEDWDRAEAALRHLDPAALEPVAGARLAAPLDYRPKIVCAGANYRDHLAEMGVTSPPDGVEPYFFIKPTTSIVRDGDPVPIPPAPARIDWEAELAVVIGRRAARLTRETALEVVAGYLPFNDITDRSRLDRTVPLAPPFRYDWMGAKGGDAFGPVGAGFVPAFHVEDPQQLRIRLWVGDELKQDSSTAEMLHDIATLLVAASNTFSLEPGDILATGTPAGVGAPHGTFLVPGDIVTVEIDGVGRISNPIAARP